jgi:hypothetical protein
MPIGILLYASMHQVTQLKAWSHILLTLLTCTIDVTAIDRDVILTVYSISGLQLRVIFLKL